MKKRKFSLSSMLLYLGLGIWALTTIYPIIWVVMNSFKEKSEIFRDSFSIPLGELFTMSNYETAFQDLNILEAYKNSIVISGAVCAFVMLFAGMASFALVRYKFKLNKFLTTVVLAAMMFPVFATIIPVFQMEHAWGIVNTGNWWLSMLSVILPQTAGNLAFAIVVLTGYIKSLPIELEEAAFIEGCGPLRIFFQKLYRLQSHPLQQ